MSTGRPPHSVPTLTEVVDWPRPAPPAADAPAGDEPTPAPLSSAAPDAGQDRPTEPSDAGEAAADGQSSAVPNAPAPGSAQAAFDAADIEQRVLADLQRQVELMLEVRLREALTPLLVRTADALVRDARKELSASLREIVTRAVTQELARRRDS